MTTQIAPSSPSMRELLALLYDFPLRHGLIGLDTASRRVLGGRHFRAGRDVALLIGDELERRPHLFSFVPFTGAAHKARRERVLELARLELALRALLQRTTDTRLKEEADMNQLSLAVLKHAEHLEAAPFSDAAQLKALEEALAPARRRMSQHWERRRRGSKGRRQRASLLPWHLRKRHLHRVVAGPPPVSAVAAPPASAPIAEVAAPPASAPIAEVAAPPASAPIAEVAAPPASAPIAEVAAPIVPAEAIIEPGEDGDREATGPALAPTPATGCAASAGPRPGAPGGPAAGVQSFHALTPDRMRHRGPHRGHIDHLMIPAQVGREGAGLGGRFERPPEQSGA